MFEHFPHALTMLTSLSKHRHDDMKDLRCMSFTSKGTGEILVAGMHDQMFVIDVHRGEITKKARHLRICPDAC